MARLTIVFKEEYSYNSTKSLISLLKPLTNLAILNSSLSCILILAKVISKSLKYASTILGPWWNPWSFNKSSFL